MADTGELLDAPHVTKPRARVLATRIANTTILGASLACTPGGERPRNPGPEPAASSPSSTCDGGEVTYTFENNCGFDIWLGEFNGNDSAGTLPTSGTWQIAAGSDATVCLPQSWSSGRFWPRTGCTDDQGHLNCVTGQCGAVGQGAADCTAAVVTPNPPVSLFEVTTNSDGSANYDMSLVNGYNVQMAITVTGECQKQSMACTADLLDTCPANLQYTVPQSSTGQVDCGNGNFCPSGTCGANDDCLIACFSPSDACLQNSASVAALGCNTTVSGVSGTDCNGNATSVEWLDMYLVKNFAGQDAAGNSYSGDNVSMISANQGTPSCFGDSDCPPVAPDCVTDGFPSSHVPPATAGVCLDLSQPGEANSWSNNQIITCSKTTVGQACGGMVAAGFADGMGYTCQPVTYTQTNGGPQTAYACLPPLTTGLGTCESSSGGSFYDGTGGVMNAAWMTAASQAGGGTPFYEIYTDACPGYSWQFDDIADDIGCSSATAFTISFCPTSG